MVVIYSHKIGILATSGGRKWKIYHSSLVSVDNYPTDSNFTRAPADNYPANGHFTLVSDDNYPKDGNFTRAPADNYPANGHFSLVSVDNYPTDGHFFPELPLTVIQQRVISR